MVQVDVTMSFPQNFWQDTIAAIATPPGRGGIGVIRFSGPLALQLAEPIMRSTRPLTPSQVRYAELLDLRA